jgi:hypothetical protein
VSAEVGSEVVVVARYVIRIEAHLVRLAEGHDPMGHLFGIERLARGARAEWWARHRRENRATRS